jgi:cyclopropane-fatty-acyl-phospholipid synthase
MATLPYVRGRAGSRMGRRAIERLLSNTDIQINGARPWDIQVHDERLFRRVVAHGSLGLGEAYMDGWWDCDQIDGFFSRLLAAAVDKQVRYLDLPLVLTYIQARFTNMQSQGRAFQVGQRHYDLGNDLYQAMLDRSVTYSCAYWDGAENLDQAQNAKLDLICRKLAIEKGMRVLDIGCGWGSFAEFAAKHYGVSVLGVTVSKEQAAYASERCKDLPVEIRLQDYRDVEGQFDRVLSIGMFEHVGRKNHPVYFRKVHRLLQNEGLTLLHTIGRNTTLRGGGVDPWIAKYIFPNGELPSMQQIVAASERHFVMEHWENLGPHYDQTLMAWWRNFEGNWDRLRHYGERFHRMWRYYLLSCAGLFRARRAQVWQLVLSKGGIPGGYHVRP